MEEEQLRRIRLRKQYASLPQDLLNAEGFDDELTELFLETVMAATENGFEVPERREWERQFKQERERLRSG